MEYAIHGIGTLQDHIHVLLCSIRSSLLLKYEHENYYLGIRKFC